MKNRYDIYSLEDREPIKTKNAQSEKGNQDTSYPAIHVFAIYVGLSLVIFISILFVWWKFGPMIVHHRISPFRFCELNDLTRAGKHYSIIGDYDEAISKYSEAILLYPWYFELHIERGKNYESKGDIISALDDYEYAISRSPSSVFALDRQASICIFLAKQSVEKNDYADALSYFERGLVDNEYLVLEWVLKYHCWRRLSIYEEREKCLILCNKYEIVRADASWNRVNQIYLQRKNDIKDPDLLAAYAEWHYGHGNYALARECLIRIKTKEQYQFFELELQEEFKLLIEFINDIILNGEHPGAKSYTSELSKETIKVTPPTTTHISNHAR
jgi:tetratricopeptide (TPR) repeat protein